MRTSNPLPQALARRRLIQALLGLPLAAAGPAAPGAAPATPGSSAATGRLALDVLLFRQPGTPPLPATATHVPDGAALAAAAAGLRRAGYPLVGYMGLILPVAAGATATLRLAEALPGAGVEGELAVTRGQLLSVHLALHCADCGANQDIDERRRVKFGERHYFDGPRVGALLVLTVAGDAAP